MAKIEITPEERETVSANGGAWKCDYQTLVLTLGITPGRAAKIIRVMRGEETGAEIAARKLAQVRSQFRTKGDIVRYIVEYAGRVDVIPTDAETVYTNVSRYQIGDEVLTTTDGTIWVRRYTGSDVSEQAVVMYRLEDTDDDGYGNDNATLVELLRGEVKEPAASVDYPDGRVLDCGCIVYHKAHVLTTSRGTSCQDCYDRMSN